MEELLNPTPKNIIISVKPEYAVKIVDGKKTVELRRKFPTENIKGGIAVIYASSPVKQVIGYAIIEDVKKLPLPKIWDMYEKKACVTKKFFNSYFKGLKEGFAISLNQITKLDCPVDIDKLDKHYSISAPQSFRYAPEKILEVIGGYPNGF